MGLICGQPAYLGVILGIMPAPRFDVELPRGQIPRKTARDKRKLPLFQATGIVEPDIPTNNRHSLRAILRTARKRPSEVQVFRSSESLEVD
jgi:hypothetical protein